MRGINRIRRGHRIEEKKRREEKKREGRRRKEGTYLFGREGDGKGNDKSR